MLVVPATVPFGAAFGAAFGLLVLAGFGRLVADGLVVDIALVAHRPLHLLCAATTTAIADGCAYRLVAAPVSKLALRRAVPDRLAA